jgi:hypothetical protein
MKDDLAAIHAWMGKTDTAAYTTAHQEMWAEAFENYLMEGKAPAADLREMFAKFSQWLTRIYDLARGAGVRPSPEIREIMDRMLATDQDIIQARVETGSVELFATRPPGMTEREWLAYTRLVDQDKARTFDAQLQKQLAKVRRRRTAEYRTRRKQVRAEWEQKLAREPVHALILRMQKEGARLDRSELIALFGADVLKKLGRGRLGGKRNIYEADGVEGMPIAQAASMHGFSSPEALVGALTEALPFTAAVDLRTDAQMQEELGDPLTEEELMEEAEAALNNPRSTERVARHRTRYCL